MVSFLTPLLIGKTTVKLKAEKDYSPFHIDGSSSDT